jgi:lysophospholipase L1-like esterase
MDNKRVWSVAALVGLALAGTVYYRVTGAQLNLATGLLLIVTVWVWLLLLVELASVTPRVSAYKRRLQVLVLTLGVLVVGTELLLRSTTPTLKTYFERNGETTYRSLLFNTGPTWFHTHVKNIDLTWTTADFVHSRRTNDLGLSERNLSREKTDREYRIIALGDSFTEGVGTDYESSWVKAMERRLAQQMPDRKVTTINAGISGSDVFFEYMLLREKLVTYAPDLVIVAVNASDIDDVILRGGMDRFQADGTSRSPRPPPRWEWLYGISYVTRLVVHGGLGYNHLFMKRSRSEIDRREAAEKIRSLMPAFADVASKHGFRLVVVFQPTGGDISFKSFGELQRVLDDLQRRGGIDVIDVMARWSAEGRLSPDEWPKLYWPTDGHHNQKGYALLGMTIADALLELESEGH